MKKNWVKPMIIDKIAINENNHKIHEYYYNSAREGMFDLFSNMLVEGLVNTLFMPGYIGWSPKEGSGIFDPIDKIEGISIEYYKMTSDLTIDFKDLLHRIQKLNNGKFAVLVVNYFGFVDPYIKDIVDIIRQYSGWIITDNAHGFFTYQYTVDNYSDATFFSLHKMFPFKCGGSLILKNKQLIDYKYRGSKISDTQYNPWKYDVRNIARIRLENYVILEAIIVKENNAEYLTPLKTNIMEGNIPQTFPIRINKGNRDRIYELMNQAGYGVVSLYHTLIEPLRCSEYQASLNLSKSIMNLPVHQDADKDKYQDMVNLLVRHCRLTSK